MGIKVITGDGVYGDPQNRSQKNVVVIGQEEVNVRGKAVSEEARFAPYINQVTGTWWQYDTAVRGFVDTGITAGDYRRDSFLSVSRMSSLAKTSDKYEEEADPDKYWYPQGTCTDGDSYVISFVSSIDGNNEEVTLRKYSASHELLLANTVAVNHANDMTYFDGKIYSTAYGNLLSRKMIAVIDYDTLEFIENKELPYDVTLIDYHDGYFYTSNSRNLIKYDTEFNYISTTNLKYKSLNRTSAHYGLIVTDKFIYIGNGYPNSIDQYDFDGRLINIWNIGYNNGDFQIGEGEGLFYSKNLGGFVLTTGAYAGYLCPTVITQNFLIDFQSGVYDGTSGRHKAYGGYSQVYVDATNTDPNPDGSAENPYREINEAIFNSVDELATVKINVAAGEYESISTHYHGPDLLIYGEDASTIKIAGVNMTYGGNVYLYKVTVTTPQALDDFYKAAMYVKQATAVLSNVVFDCEECTNGLKVEDGDVTFKTVSFSDTISYSVHGNYSKLIFGEVTFVRSLPLYTSVCVVLRPDNLAFMNNSARYFWEPFRYNLSTATGAVGTVTIAGWIKNFITGQKYKKIGLILQLDSGDTEIVYGTRDFTAISHTMINPTNPGYTYYIQFSLDNTDGLKITKNGYLHEGSWTDDATHLKLTGVFIE